MYFPLWHIDNISRKKKQNQQILHIVCCGSNQMRVRIRHSKEIRSALDKPPLDKSGLCLFCQYRARNRWEKNNLKFMHSFLQFNSYSLSLHFSLSINLKELCTSEITLAQKIVLTPLNNEYRFKNSYLTSFMLKNPPEFLKKIHKNQF